MVRIQMRKGDGMGYYVLKQPKFLICLSSQCYIVMDIKQQGTSRGAVVVNSSLIFYAWLSHSDGSADTSGGLCSGCERIINPGTTR